MNAVASLLVAVCVSVLCAVALAFGFSGLNPAIAMTSLGLGAAAGVFQFLHYRKNNTAAEGRPVGPWEWLVIVAYALFSLRAFCWIAFVADDQIKFLSPNNLGDLALHLTYINTLANGVPFWPEEPIFAGVKLHYPLGVDLLNSLMKLAGMDVYQGLVLVGLLSSLATGVALYQWGRGFAIAGFLFNGGLAGFEFFKTWRMVDFQAALAWKSIPLAMFVTQRGLLYAIPAGLVLLWSWRARFFPGKDAERGRPLAFWVEALLYATMPLFHFHTFVFLSFLLGSWMLWHLLTQWNNWRKNHPLLLVAVALLPATACVMLVAGGFQGSSAIHVAWDWMYRDQPQFATWAAGLGLPVLPATVAGHLACWAVNYGIFPLCVVALIVVLALGLEAPGTRRAAAFVFPSALIFLFSYFVMLAPWDWDNTKLMIWPYLAVLPFVWEQLLARRIFAVRATACIALFFSGFVTLFGGVDGGSKGFDLATRSEVDAVGAAVKDLPATAVFASFPTYNHPLLLNGRIVVAGYPGHLWSHGIDSSRQLNLLEILMNGEEGWREAARELHVRYIYWGDKEDARYPQSTLPWTRECLKVAEGSFGEIYDLDAKAKPAATSGEEKAAGNGGTE